MIAPATCGRSSTQRVATAAMLTPCLRAIPQAVEQAWNSAQPPKSSMISLYLTSERLANGPPRLGLRRASARTGSRRRACRSRGASRRAPRTAREAVLRPRRRAANIAPACETSGTPASSSAPRVRRVEIGAADLVGSCPRRWRSVERRARSRARPERHSPTSGTARGRGAPCRSRRSERSMIAAH